MIGTLPVELVRRALCFLEAGDLGRLGQVSKSLPAAQQHRCDDAWSLLSVRCFGSSSPQPQVRRSASAQLGSGEYFYSFFKWRTLMARRWLQSGSNSAEQVVQDT